MQKEVIYDWSCAGISGENLSKFVQRGRIPQDEQLIIHNMYYLGVPIVQDVSFLLIPLLILKNIIRSAMTGDRCVVVVHRCHRTTTRTRVTML